MRINYSGKMLNVVAYHVNKDDYLVDMDEVAALAREHRPKMIVAGWSAYSRQLDFARFREIADEVGALLFVDMAHFAGLVAAGLHPSPMEHAHVVTTTTHKTLGGPRGGVILTNDPDIAKKMNSAVFPGMQGGPLEHVIAAKAVSFKVAAGEEFADRQRRTVAGAATLAARLSEADVREAGISVLTGGTDVHLVLVDLRDSELDGKAAEDRLHSIGVTVNRNAVPFDPRPPMVTSGLRIGTPGARHPRVRRGGVRRGGRHRGPGPAAGLRRGPRAGPARPGQRPRRRLPALPRPHLTPPPACRGRRTRVWPSNPESGPPIRGGGSGLDGQGPGRSGL